MSQITSITQGDKIRSEYLIGKGIERWQSNLMLPPEIGKDVERWQSNLMLPPEIGKGVERWQSNLTLPPEICLERFEKTAEILSQDN
jgi:hypothetical protein